MIPMLLGMEMSPLQYYNNNLVSDAGADINRATYDATFTALHHALAKGYFDCAKILIDKGADLNLLNEGGCFGTSLHYAVFKDSIEFVKYVLGLNIVVVLLPVV